LRNGTITIPASIRRQDGIEAGEELEIERLGRGEYRLSRAGAARSTGLVDWLLACPEKGFFEPLDTSATTDSIAEQYRRAYASDAGLGEEFAGRADQGHWPED
jgi:AbrB family looped-hinge helix DNA binding protein